MKKKISLVNLNKNEVKKNGMKELLKEELGATIGGGKCFLIDCWCSCDGPGDSYYNDIHVRDNNNQWTYLFG